MFVAASAFLAKAGAEVTLAVRRPDAAEPVAADIMRTTAAKNVKVAVLDLADLNSVAHFVAGWTGPLHVLINNAGIMALPALEQTGDGWEMQFATNFLGHFALTVGLHPALAAAKGARVVSVSSSAHMIAPVIFDDPHFNFVPYDPLVAYGQSKTACALLAVEASRRWSNEGASANALNPGAIATNLQKHTGGLKTPPERRKSVSQGAATSVLLAASPFLDGVGGKYFEDCNEAEVVRELPPGFGEGTPPTPWMQTMPNASGSSRNACCRDPRRTPRQSPLHNSGKSRSSTGSTRRPARPVSC